MLIPRKAYIVANIVKIILILLR